MPRGSAPGERRGGRQKGTPNKATAEIKELALQYSDKALQKIVDLIDCDEPKTAFAAAQEILNRAYGKPKQQMDVELNAKIDLVDRMAAARKRAGQP